MKDGPLFIYLIALKRYDSYFLKAKTANKRTIIWNMLWSGKVFQAIISWQDIF